MNYRGERIPLAQYHGVPKGWYRHQIVALHTTMHGTYPVGDFELGPWGAPSWMPERYEWLLYKTSVSRLAKGVRAGDAACVEIAIRYIELRYIGSNSGYLRARLACALKSAALSSSQKARLQQHFLHLTFRREYSEFPVYRKLWARFVTPDILGRLTAHFEHSGNDSDRQWLSQLAAACANNVENARGRPMS